MGGNSSKVISDFSRAATKYIGRAYTTSTRHHIRSSCVVAQRSRFITVPPYHHKAGLTAAMFRVSATCGLPDRMFVIEIAAEKATREIDRKDQRPPGGAEEENGGRRGTQLYQ